VWRGGFARLEKHLPRYKCIILRYFGKFSA
jgi:hypothetical protein